MPAIDESLMRESALCAYANMRKAVRVLAQRYDAALSTLDLKGTQFTVLSHIAQTQPVTIVKLAELLVLDRTTLTRNLRPLINAGFVETSEGQDRREKIVKLTTAGKDLYSRALVVWKSVQEEVVGELGNEKYDQLLNLTSDLTGQDFR